MKIYISADMEGIAGITHFDETIKEKNDYNFFADQMTKEVNAACEGALEAGAKEIFVRDAHETGRNINIRDLPTSVKVIRGYSEDPLSMVQGLDESFDGVIFIGYHSPSYSKGNPMSHTMHAHNIVKANLNGEVLSEFKLHSLAAQMFNVPSIFVSGDKRLIETIKKDHPNIYSLSVFEGNGKTVTSIHPNLAIESIKSRVKEALSKDLKSYNIKVPKEFELEIEYIRHIYANRASYFPGVRRVNDNTISFRSNDYYEILRAGLFLF